MKIRFLIVLSMAAAAFSCRKENPVPKTTAEEYIEFRTPFARSAAIDNVTELAAVGGFKVWAYQHSSDWVSASEVAALLDNTSVVSYDNGTTWRYGYRIPWPETDKVSFFAYGPSDCPGATVNVPNRIPALDFVVAADPAAQKDLLIATPAIDRTSTSSPVSMELNHALSRVSFHAKKADNVIREIIMTKVELKNIYFKGSTTLQSPISWTVDDTATQDYTLSIAAGTLADIATTTTLQPVSTPTGTLLMLPQTFAPDAEVIITFTYNGTEQTIRKELPDVSAWAPTVSYNYQIIFDQEEVFILCATLESTSNGSWGAF